MGLRSWCMKIETKAELDRALWLPEACDDLTGVANSPLIVGAFKDQFFGGYYLCLVSDGSHWVECGVLSSFKLSDVTRLETWDTEYTRRGHKIKGVRYLTLNNLWRYLK